MGVTTNERNGPSTNNCSLTMSIQCTCLACSAFRSKINLEFIYNEKLLCTKYYTLNNPYQKCPSPPNWTKNKGTLLKQKLQDRNSINCKLRKRPIYCIALSSTTISLGRKHRVLLRLIVQVCLLPYTLVLLCWNYFLIILATVCMYYRVGLRLLPHNKMCAPADRYHHHSSVLLVNPHPVQHRPFFPFSSYILYYYLFIYYSFFSQKKC